MYALLAATLLLWQGLARSQVPDSSIELSVNITALQTSGDWVEVCRNHHSPSRDDLLTACDS